LRGIVRSREQDNPPEARGSRRVPAEAPAGFVSFGATFMYAVVKTGGKQYRVAPGDKLKVESLASDVGAQVVLDQVLMIGGGSDVRVGAPTLGGATVMATVVSHGRHDKVKIFKMRRRKHYQKHQGHRQNYTELRIDTIAG
jgi:large subunit ribosomal protein L21